MRKVLLLVLLVLLISSCKVDEKIDYSIYNQMNENLQINNINFKITECFVNPLDFTDDGYKIITVIFDYKEGSILSSNVKIFNPLTNEEYSYYTVDGLDYLKDPRENASIRFKVKEEQNDFVLKLNICDDIVFVHIKSIEIK